MAIIDLMVTLSNWFWGVPILVVLVGGGIFLTVRLGFYQFRYLPFILKNTFGKMFAKSEGEGTVSAFQAATTALASSIGASNIVGVPVAIALGGPGAVFWMWVTALVGCATKFTEIVLGIKYREKNEKGEYVGGAMYYLKHSKFPFLGTVFAFMLMIEIAPSISTQTLTFIQNAEHLGIDKYVAVGAFLIVVALVVFGGIKSISGFCEKLVPIMAGLYILAGLVVIAVNIVELPHVFGMIFSNAFTPTSAMGGFAGATVAAGIRSGLARGAYSNEAGMGTATIAHSAATVEIPAQQGIWAVFEIFVDTMIVCTITAVVVLVSGVWTEIGSDQAAVMPAMAFGEVLGQNFGGALVAIALLMFVLSTVIVIIFFGEKQAEFLFGSKVAMVVRVIYILFIILGVVLDLGTLYSLLDFMLALVIIPNMIGILTMSGEAVEMMKQLFENPKYYPKAKK
ncbi:amino acid carrier protein [Peptoniphilus sp. KCTC 25270]|uniref:alanine/glycine:cation symporter family protein n=1 Tax=Peptoniphilus sp. KCTC 25270 TaxID=2897414 RepID=UPI001E313374|nr:amino acid carrier protein [Peptoniphilus sp. KCTC 25270]MCD1146505.1 amino acid carrier protein [Peptoniphilus sp. KCTC 25270]